MDSDEERENTKGKKISSRQREKKTPYVVWLKNSIRGIVLLFHIIKGNLVISKYASVIFANPAGI